ncbi:hypothetical protein QQP08_020162, partial [Theobroma cacao]
RHERLGGRDKSPKIIRRKIRKEVSGGMQALFWRSGLMTGKFRQEESRSGNILPYRSRIHELDSITDVKREI